MTKSVRNATPPSRISHWRGEFAQMALMLCLLFVARSSFANHYVVPSGSMQHSLEIGDRVVVDMRAYGLRLPITDTVLWPTGLPQRGDVAVFDSPLDGTRLIKRVVAVGGDRVRLRNGHLWINGQSLGNSNGASEQLGQHRAQLDLDQVAVPILMTWLFPQGRC